MTPNREKKQAIVAKLSEKVEKAQALVFTNYAGMTHVQLEQLKKGLRAVNAELAVVKNTLLKRALKQGESKEPFTLDASPFSLDGPTATLFAFDDPIPALKELAKSIKKLKLPTIKFGIFDGKVLAEKDVVRLSTLPSHDVLLAQFVGGLKSPLFGLHRALSWNLLKLVTTLKAIEKTKTS